MNETEKTQNETMTQSQWIEYLTEEFHKMQLPVYPLEVCSDGIMIDFCYGARVYIPPNAPSKQYLVDVVDLDNDVKIYSGVLDAGDYYISEKRYYINYGIQLSEYPSGKAVVQKKFNAENRNVVIKLPITTLGDTLAWFRSVDCFQQKHKCKLFVCIAEYIKPLLAPMYPEIDFITQEIIPTCYPYGCYTLAIFHDDEEHRNSPVDYRQVPLHHYPAYVLGVPTSDEPPEIDFPYEDREIPEPYVVIATQASGGCKLWNHPLGWDKVVAFLKQSGYRVIDIDLEAIHGQTIHWNKIPREAEDFTGNHPLTQRANLIYHADFFIGLGSGLSWLSWCVGKPTVLISGFSESWGEFPTPYRVINRNVCHGCFNDPRHRFDHHDYLWCPKHQGTPRHWECSRGITASPVIAAIQRIPEFINHIKNKENGDGQ